MWLVALKFLKPVGKLLAFGVTIPLGVILAAGLWVHFDKGSSVRQAVDRAVTQLVVGVELEAAKAALEAQQLVNAELRAKAEALEGANQRFAESLQQAQQELENANGELQEFAAQPVNNACIVDGSILERLRNR